MKAELRLFICVFVSTSLACSLFSNISRTVSEAPTTDAEIPHATIPPTVQPDDGSRYPVHGCGMKYGYINRHGELMIPYQFGQAGHFHEGLAVAGSMGSMNRETYELEAGQYGYVDATGKFVIEPIFSGAGIFSEGLAIAASADDPKLFGYIDKTGTFVIEPQYFGSVPNFNQTTIDARDFHEGYAVVPRPRLTTVDDFLVMYIDKNGTVLDPPGALRTATYFSDGLAIVQTERETHIIDTRGQIVASVDDCNFNGCHVGPFSEGLASIERNTGVWMHKGFIDTRGTVVIKEQFKDGKAFSEGLAAVMDDTTNLWGYIDPTGTLVIPYQYLIAQSFSEGLAGVTLPDMSGGYIDKTGNMVIQFEDAQTSFPGQGFQGGLVLVGDGYMDSNGEWVYRPNPADCP